MENISIPLISPLSRKYYQYANDDSEWSVILKEQSTNTQKSGRI